LVESPTNICLRRRIFLAGLICAVNNVLDIFAAPSITQEIGRDLEEITLALCRIHFRQCGGQEAAVALLKQIVGHIATSGYAQKIAP
jgi:hypothetical protein